MLKDHFKDPNQWKYIADDVMGGVSKGNVEFQNVGKNKQKTLENYYKKEQEKCVNEQK